MNVTDRLYQCLHYYVSVVAFVSHWGKWCYDGPRCVWHIEHAECPQPCPVTPIRQTNSCPWYLPHCAQTRWSNWLADWGLISVKRCVSHFPKVHWRVGWGQSSPWMTPANSLSIPCDPVMPRFAEQVEVAIEALSTTPSQAFEENEFIDASRLVYDGVRDIRKAVLMIRVCLLAIHLSAVTQPTSALQNDSQSTCHFHDIFMH